MGNAIGPGDDLESLDAGVLFGFGGFSLGGNVFANTDFNEAQCAAAGLKYRLRGGERVGGLRVLRSRRRRQHQPGRGFSGDIGLMQGVTLKGDVTYNTDAPDANAGEDTDESHRRGCVTVQLDY